MIKHALLECEPRYASNDYWKPAIAEELRSRMSALQADPEASAGLVVGAGSLPYTLDALPPTIVVADLDKQVVDGVSERCDFVANQAGSWQDYIDEFGDKTLGVNLEFSRMQESGLIGDFEQVSAAARRLRLVPLLGNVVTGAARLFESADMRGKRLTFINFTNVMEYVAPSNAMKDRDDGGLVLSALVRSLPVHPEAVVCDSSVWAQHVSLYTPDEFTLRFSGVQSDS